MLRIKKILTGIIILSTLIAYNSCTGCVKKTAKKTTELVGSAMDGVNEAVSEDEGKVAEGATDAAGTVAEGTGRSLDKQLDKNTNSIFTVAARTTLQAVDAIVSVVDEDMASKRFDYDTLTYTAKLPKEISIDFIGKLKHYNFTFDIYYNLPNGTDLVGTYIGMDEKGDTIAKWTLMSVYRSADDRRSFTRETFGLSGDKGEDFRKIKSFHITVEEKGKINNE